MPLKAVNPKKKLTKTISIRVTEEEYQVWRSNSCKRENLMKSLRLDLKKS